MSWTIVKPENSEYFCVGVKTKEEDFENEHQIIGYGKSEKEAMEMALDTVLHSLEKSLYFKNKIVELAEATQTLDGSLELSLINLPNEESDVFCFYENEWILGIK